MIKTFSAFTAQIDDITTAVSEIKEQLPPQDELLSQSIGIISCLPEFIESGVVEALQEALPFEFIGMTTIAGASPKSSELEILNILLITSDELEFVRGLSAPITGEIEDEITSSYITSTLGRTDKPAFVLVYAPLLLNVGGDFIIEALDKVSDHVPIFGSLSIDNTLDYHLSRVIFQGEQYSDRLAFIAFYGDLHPTFYLATISHDKIFDSQGIVTCSDGNLVKSIDGKTTVEYMLSKGLITNEFGEVAGINSFPYIIDLNDGNPPVIRIIFATTPEGYAVCLGDIPEGSTLSVGYFDEDEIVATTRRGLQKFVFSEDMHAGIIFSCIGRYYTMQLDPEGETKAVHEFIDRFDKAYTLAYSGGEICPVTNIADNVSLTNRFHNSTFVALIF